MRTPGPYLRDPVRQKARINPGNLTPAQVAQDRAVALAFAVIVLALLLNI